MDMLFRITIIQKHTSLNGLIFAKLCHLRVSPHTLTCKCWAINLSPQPHSAGAASLVLGHLKTANSHFKFYFGQARSYIPKKWGDFTWPISNVCALSNSSPVLVSTRLAFELLLTSRSFVSSSRLAWSSIRDIQDFVRVYWHSPCQWPRVPNRFCMRIRWTSSRKCCDAGVHGLQKFFGKWRYAGTQWRCSGFACKYAQWTIQEKTSW